MSYYDYLTFGGAIKEYLTVTSTHGLRRIGWAHHGIARFIWFILFLIAFGLYVYCVHLQFEEYRDYPYRLQASKAQDFTEFAGVTVCNMNPRKTDTIENTVMDPFLQFGKNTKWDMENKTDGDIAPYFQRRAQFTRFLTDRGIANRVSNAHHLEDLILHCSFDGRECNMNRDFIGFWSNTFGNCFTFNGGKMHSQYFRRQAAKLGPLTGLSLILNIEQDSYLNALSANKGVKVLVHAPTEMPFPEEEGYAVPPNTEAMIGVEMTEIRHLSSPYTDCHDGISNRYDYSYSTLTCRKLCEQQKILEKCKCLDPVLPLVPDYPICNMHDKADKYYMCREDVKRAFENHEDDCSCSVPCTETKYNTEISLSKWPSEQFGTKGVAGVHSFLDKILYFAYRRNTTYGNKAGNFVSVKVYFTDLGKLVLTEEATYSLALLLLRIGGLSALFIGASVISGLEFLELIFTLLTIPCIDYEPWEAADRRRAERRHRVNRQLIEPPTVGRADSLKPSTEAELTDGDINSRPLPAIAHQPTTAPNKRVIASN